MSKQAIELPVTLAGEEFDIVCDIIKCDDGKYSPLFDMYSSRLPARFDYANSEKMLEMTALLNGICKAIEDVKLASDTKAASAHAIVLVRALLEHYDNSF